MSSKIEIILREYPSDYVNYTDLFHLLSGTDDSRYAQIKRALKEGYLISLRKGLYYRGLYLQQQKPHPFEMAQRLVWPSYVSLESALSYYNLIPEAIYNHTSVSPKRKTQVANSLGFFSYEKGNAHNFFLGVNREMEANHVFLIADPWKAIADYIYCYKKNDSLEELSINLRLETSELPTLEPEYANALTTYYASNRVKLFLKECLRNNKS